MPKEDDGEEVQCELGIEYRCWEMQVVHSIPNEGYIVYYKRNFELGRVVKLRDGVTTVHKEKAR
jgi:hypothetical protein